MNPDKKPVVFIAGLGLIGGSIAHALKRSDFARLIIAYDKDEHALEYAMEKLIISKSVQSLSEGATEADIIILAAPVGAIIESIAELGKIETGNALITDAGSTKQEIVAAAVNTGLGRQFVGGHPMAGAEKTGVQNAKADLFKDAFFFLTPTGETEPDKLETAKNLATALSAKPVEITPEKHDRIVAFGSHLPYLLSAALKDAVMKEKETNPKTAYGCASGYESCTRLAKGSPEMGADMLSTNSENVLKAFKTMNASLEELISRLEAGKRDELRDLLSKIAAMQ
ncbi:MAG: prephenate dehydrogenase/arogenate dehydrogenase family protein [Planctomycetota bacterium]|nr:MAG: prephenate dehydrogenase/arogenate dehydrogenase family protein [Planctomycetota bacterium]